jgi:hypothetical protein
VNQELKEFKDLLERKVTKEIQELKGKLEVLVIRNQLLLIFFLSKSNYDLGPRGLQGLIGPEG